MTGAVLVMLGEVGARIDERVRYGTPIGASPDMNGDLTVQDSIGLRGRPHGQFKNFRLNSEGFRSPEGTLTPMPKPGCVRVMTFGSSETFGYEEPPGQEYPAQLADSRQAFGSSLQGGLLVWSLRSLHELQSSRFVNNC